MNTPKNENSAATIIGPDPKVKLNLLAHLDGQEFSGGKHSGWRNTETGMFAEIPQRKKLEAAAWKWNRDSGRLMGHGRHLPSGQDK